MRIPTFSQFQQQAARISKEFDQMSRLQQQSSSGEKLINSSDDPALAFQIKAKQDYLNTLQGYKDNGSMAKNRATELGVAIQNAVNIGTDVQTLLKQAQSGTLNDHDRAEIAEKLQGSLTSLLQIANTTDANGEYIFSGTNSTIPAYQLVNGSYQYQGGPDPTRINIAPNNSILYTEAGNRVFGHLYDGNGTFKITASSTNQGTAYLTSNSVNNSSYIPDNYSLQFFTNSNGQLAYQVTGATAGQVIPAPPATLPQDAPVFVPGQVLTFNGMSMSIQGTPAAGDSFQVQPSAQQNVFNELQDMIDLLKAPVTNRGEFNQAINQAGNAFSQIMDKFNGYQSTAGTRSAIIDEQLNVNANTVTNQTVALSGLADCDLFSVYSALAQQSLILQSTQESYMKMQAVLEKIMQL